MKDIHSCSYYCNRPECVLAQRNELRDKLAQQSEPEPEPVALKMSDLPMSGGIDSRVEFKNRRGPVRVVVTGDEIYTVAPPPRHPLTDEEIDKAIAQERDALLDHVYEYGTTAEGVLRRVRRLARAVEAAHGIEEAK